jgi:uncharacterized protein (DUF1697 family)
VTTYIGLLRAINLAGRNVVPMAGLRDMLLRLGLTEPRSLLQSGNVLFQSRPRTAAQLEKTLEAELKKQFGVDTDFMVRTPTSGAPSSSGIRFRRKRCAIPGICSSSV